MSNSIASPIKEAWDSGRPVYSRLPSQLNAGVYLDREPAIPDWLTAFWDALFVQTRATVDDIPRQLNPLTCDAIWLDFLAPLFGWDAKYWDKTWSEAGKRALLSNSYSGVDIWRNKGTLDTAHFVLSAVGIRNILVVQGDFVIGENLIGDRIGSLPWEYSAIFPLSYRGGNKHRAALHLLSLFVPCYLIQNIAFSYELFIVDELLVTDSGEIIEASDQVGILGRESDGE